MLGWAHLRGRVDMGKHTPGPWTVEPEWKARCGGDVSIVNRDAPGDDWDVCIIHSTEANARLIASAPCLLEAARMAIAAMESMWVTEDRDDDYIYDEMGSEMSSGYFALREAIAKATHE